MLQRVRDKAHNLVNGLSVTPSASVSAELEAAGLGGTAGFFAAAVQSLLETIQRSHGVSLEQPWVFKVAQPAGETLSSGPLLEVHVFPARGHATLSGLSDPEPHVARFHHTPQGALAAVWSQRPEMPPYTWPTSGTGLAAARMTSCASFPGRPCVLPRVSRTSGSSSRCTRTRSPRSCATSSRHAVSSVFFPSARRTRLDVHKAWAARCSSYPNDRSGREDRRCTRRRPHL
ncbi:hypothetical protein DMC30DRAFT_289512 [Rhodotorula diobovata]|uniref:Uncharacterized protein n=1 Tax=Rhodotorula diobovata TaxID=5288 RepID=A0A5C5FU54_9BASI|nr:hypothetical protein DMC30DRAFT_289512 [Rhodotorula diobovata]